MPLHHRPHGVRRRACLLAALPALPAGVAAVANPLQQAMRRRSGSDSTPAKESERELAH